jgi:hypothetical protein
MRLGCGGCLGLVIFLVSILASAGAGFYFAGAILHVPSVPKPDYTAVDGHRAQQKLFELLRRDSLRTPRQGPVVITERELNAFLASHLEENEGLPFSPLIVKLSPGKVEIQGQTRLKNLMQALPLRLLPAYLPASVFERPVWVTVRGAVRLHAVGAGGRRQYGRLEPSAFSLGSQPLGRWLLQALLGSREERLLRWPVPAGVDLISVEQERIVVTTRR